MACAANDTGQCEGVTPTAQSTRWIHTSRQRAYTVPARSPLRKRTGRAQSAASARSHAASNLAMPSDRCVIRSGDTASFSMRSSRSATPPGNKATTSPRNAASVRVANARPPSATWAITCARVHPGNAVAAVNSSWDNPDTAATNRLWAVRTSSVGTCVSTMRTIVETGTDNRENSRQKACLLRIQSRRWQT
jgi:hypothetical protein